MQLYALFKSLTEHLIIIFHSRPVLLVSVNGISGHEMIENKRARDAACQRRWSSCFGTFENV
jgi:hypothetical protein